MTISLLIAIDIQCNSIIIFFYILLFNKVIIYFSDICLVAFKDKGDLLFSESHGYQKYNSTFPFGLLLKKM